MYVGEPPSSYSSLWNGYTVLSEVHTKLFSSFSTTAVVSFRYRSGMESVQVLGKYTHKLTMYNFLYTVSMYDWLVKLVIIEVCTSIFFEQVLW